MNLIENIVERVKESTTDEDGIILYVDDKPIIAKQKVIDLIHEEAKAYNDGWIPCEERLPENFVHVLVWFEYFRYGDYNRLFQTHGISYTYKGEWSGFVNGSSGWQQLRIIAWMPLPEPYKPTND